MQRNKIDVVGTQMDLFGNAIAAKEPDFKPVFCIKEHYTDNMGHYYDWRIQIPMAEQKRGATVLANCFILKNGPSMNPQHKPIASPAHDQDIKTFRREGSILRGPASGAVLEFDEGGYSIPGCKTAAEMSKAYQQGIIKGNLTLFFEGRKMKGLFRLTRKTPGIHGKWIIQKLEDEYASDKNILLQNRSVLSGKTIAFFIEMYQRQKEEMARMSERELKFYYSKHDQPGYGYTSRKIA